MRKCNNRRILQCRRDSLRVQQRAPTRKPAGVLRRQEDTRRLHLPVCEHTHSTTLTIAPGGKVGYSYSPRCKLHGTHGFDSLNVYAVAEHNGDLKAAIRALAPARETKPNALAPGPTPEQRAARRKDAERKRAARKQAAADLRLMCWAAPRSMPICRKPPRSWPDIHLTIADTRGWHRASVARQAELAGYSERWTQKANEYLVRHGYLSRQETSGTTTAIWTFTRNEGRLPVETSESENQRFPKCSAAKQ